VQNGLRVEVYRVEGATVLAVAGELDLATSHTLEEQLELVSAGSNSAEPLILDLTELEFMDSTGLSVLVKAHQRARDAGRRFGLIRGHRQVERLLSLTGVAERMLVADSLRELLAG
jgi:anti-sigma B factor antagonist